MKNVARFVVCASLAAATVHAFARAVILKESINTYHSALEESNKTKAEAMLRGLLIQQVSVAVDLPTLPPKQKGYESAVQEGMRRWNTALGDTVFVQAHDAATADIVVSFVDTVASGDDQQGGLSAQKRVAWNHGKVFASITGDLAIRNFAGDRAISLAEIEAVTAHELGHLLGLDDEHEGSGIMSDFVPDRQYEISTDELNAVRLFRGKVEQALTVMNQGG